MKKFVFWEMGLVALAAVTYVLIHQYGGTHAESVFAATLAVIAVFLGTAVSPYLFPFVATASILLAAFFGRHDTIAFFGTDIGMIVASCIFGVVSFRTGKIVGTGNYSRMVLCVIAGTATIGALFAAGPLLPPA